MRSRRAYNTRQQNIILDTFQANPDKCYTAGELLQLLAGTGIGEATIYRSLQKLVIAGAIKKFAPAPGHSQEDSRRSKASYQYAAGQEKCNDHFHLKCLRCGNVIHMDCGFMGEINRYIAEEHHFTVDNSQTTLYGLCSSCAETCKNTEETE